jgi:hypothetical protein
MKKISLIIFILIPISVGGWLYLNLNRKNTLKNFYQTITNKKTVTEEKNETTPTLSNNSNEIKELPFEIVSPQNNATVSTATIIIAGKTKPNADVFVGEKQLVADSNGSFSTSYQLEEGQNEIVIAANDDLGNYAEKNLIINLETSQ